jgi:hypothetical protein
LVLERLLGVVPSVNGDERRLAVLAKTAGVLPVHHGAAGEDHDVILLAQREPRADLRTALVALWRLRHATHPGCGPKPGGAAGVVLPVLQALIAGQLEPSCHGAYRRVAGVLSRVVRASSVVECLNSVVRMHQARHRTLSQALLDLPGPIVRRLQAAYSDAVRELLS